MLEDYRTTAGEDSNTIAGILTSVALLRINTNSTALSDCVEMMNDTMVAQAIETENRWKTQYQLVENRFRFGENILNGGKHLDFGCGFGAFAKILAEKYPQVQVYGIDPDREKIEIGKHRYKLPNLHLLHSNRLVGKYCSCTAFFVLHEIADTRTALNDLYEHLNMDGKIMVDDFRKRDKVKYREWYEKGRRECSFEEEYRKHSRWTVKEFERMCEDAGFKTIEIKQRGGYWLLYVGEK